MQIPILRGREIAESDRQGTLPVAVVSEFFARTNFGDAIRLDGASKSAAAWRSTASRSSSKSSGCRRTLDTAG